MSKIEIVLKNSLLFFFVAVFPCIVAGICITQWHVSEHVCFYISHTALTEDGTGAAGLAGNTKGIGAQEGNE